ncbi:DUF411 domain-containing protein [Vogesella sp. DC21W]|uniref:DUF411 domain-containing protein n=1 Tax=Vogesella aquatica TaxID=2984206 RepID=A0ABT5IUX9_9NEIS|nr:DUF411 domain-containing protein [Vogesella aquatica]MDC7716001.1 DUF411 domain-containing protein [Vogesella aquatica]
MRTARLLFLALAISLPVLAADSGQLYKDPSCGCCGKWATHMRANKLALQSQDRSDMAQLKDRLGVPASLRSCHTAQIGGYTIEGHVPAAMVQQLLRDRPAIAGLAVAGMPQGSPGMETGIRDSYQVMAFTRAGRQYVYATIKGG